MKNHKDYPPEVQQVRAAWKDSGMLQPSFGKACGVSPGVMVQILTNGYYSRASIERVQAALKLTPPAPVAPVVAPAPPVAAPIPKPAPAAALPASVERTTSPKQSWMKPAVPLMSENVKAANAELQQQLAGAQGQVTEARVSLGTVQPGSPHERALTQALTLITQVRFAITQGEL